MDIDILSLFPEDVSGPLETSILKRAREKGLLNISYVQIRDFATGKHKKVDDRPYGGGPGMVLKPEPICKAIDSVRREDSLVISLSPQGKVLTPELAKELSTESHLILLSGHYEGIDERVVEQEVDMEVSIGDYVLTNGMIAAFVLTDVIARFIPGVLGHPEAAEQDSFQNVIFDSPHYTRPEVFRGETVPNVLLKGNHGQIAHWRHQAALAKTRQVRPDLFFNYMGERAIPSSEYREQKGLEVTLCVKNLKQSLQFYRKVLGLKVLNTSDTKAFFQIGESVFTLVEGKEESLSQANTVLRLIEKDLMRFKEIAYKLVKANRMTGKLLVKSGEEGSQLAFSDVDGHPWVLFCPEGE